MSLAWTRADMAIEGDVEILYEIGEFLTFYIYFLWFYGKVNLRDGKLR